MRKNYLAYGSNLNVCQMLWRCPTAKVIGKTEIEGYRLLFKGSKTGSYLTIEPCEGKKVPVGVWSVTEEDIANLDRYEGFPTFYYRKEMKVTVKGEPLDAFVYIMHEDRKLGICSDTYFQTCLEGYEDFAFDPASLYEADEYSMERACRNEK